MYLLSKINGRGVLLMFITRSSGMSHESKTSLIAQWKEKPISFREPGDTGCFAAVAYLLVKPIFRKIEWHHEKSKFKLPPFFQNYPFTNSNGNVVGDDTPDLPHIFNHLQTLSSNSNGRRVFTPRSFLESSLSSSFWALAAQ